MFLFSLSIFLSAFLLFQIQPMIGRGSPRFVRFRIAMMKLQ
jgi:hypothetical protein